MFASSATFGNRFPQDTHCVLQNKAGSFFGKDDKDVAVRGPLLPSPARPMPDGVDADTLGVRVRLSFARRVDTTVPRRHTSQGEPVLNGRPRPRVDQINVAQTEHHHNHRHPQVE